MVAANVSTFGGMIPAVDARLLPDHAAAYSENTWLYSGTLKGIAEPKVLHEITLPQAGRVYRLPASYNNSEYMYDSVWMEFADVNTNVLRAPVFGDLHDRYYWVSPTTPARYNTRQRIEAGSPAWLLGVPVPPDITVTPTGGSGTTGSRAYVVTWVTEYGEEGPPSPAFLLTNFLNATYTVGLPAVDAGDLGVDRNLAFARIYRTVVSSSGVATYFLVEEVPIADTTYADTKTDADIAGNEQLESTLWTAPPSDLKGWIAMPNGIIAAWRGNELWFSEPYRPHAWPAAYVLTMEYPIVGLGIVNQTLVCCTGGYPVTVSGSLPSQMTDSKLTTFEPCTSRGSILSTPEGVYYSSPNGLILVVPGRAENVTRNLITVDRWQELTGATRFRAARLGTAYYGFGSVVPGVVESGWVDETWVSTEDFSGASEGVLIDPLNERVAFNMLTSPDPLYGVQNDPWSGAVLLLRDNKVYWLDLADPDRTYSPFRWRSKILQSGQKENFGAMKVYFRVPSGVTVNPVQNISLEQELAEDQYGLVRLYADEVLVMTRELRHSGELFRLPSGFKADFWQWEIEARVEVLSVGLGSSPKDLRAV